MADINYSSRDFEQIRDDLLSRAASLVPEWTARDSSDFGVMMVDLWAYFADVLHYYIDRASREAFITTATQRESMLAIANLFDYQPQLQTAATSEVTVIGNNIPSGETVVIPAGTVFVSPATSSSPVVYFTSTASASASSASSPTIIVFEGEQVTDETLGTSTGMVNQRYTLYYPKVIGNSVTISVREGTLVNGIPTLVEYFQVDKLYNSAPGDRVFKLVLNASNEVEVLFGNGVNGKIPNAGQLITASYRKGKGAAGNLPANQISQIQNSPSNYLSKIYSTQATGGSDVESIASLKTNIPAAFSTQNRAVSLNDYKSLVLNIAGVAKGTASYNSSTKVVTIYAAPFTSDYLSYAGASLPVNQTLRDNIISYYEPRQLIGASVTSASAVALTAVNITASVYVYSNYVASKVKTAVETALDNLFTFDNVYFNQTLTKGQIYRTILNVEGVDYVTISLPSTETISSGAYGLFKKGTYSITTVGGITGS